MPPRRLQVETEPMWGKPGKTCAPACICHRAGRAARLRIGRRRSLPDPSRPERRQPTAAPPPPLVGRYSPSRRPDHDATTLPQCRRWPKSRMGTRRACNHLAGRADGLARSRHIETGSEDLHKATDKRPAACPKRGGGRQRCSAADTTLLPSSRDRSMNPRNTAPPLAFRCSACSILVDAKHARGR
jgi:hypothetical protein